MVKEMEPSHHYRDLLTKPTQLCEKRRHDFARKQPGSLQILLKALLNCSRGNEMRLLFVAATLTFALGGCTAAPDVEPAEGEPAPMADLPVEPDQGSSSDLPSEETESATPCSAEVEAAVEETIRAQTAAMAAGDFVLAHSYASSGFQALVSVEAFEELITLNYMPLVEASRLDFADCIHDRAFELAYLNVQLGETGSGAYQIRYVMLETPEGWRVSEASNLQSVGTTS